MTTEYNELYEGKAVDIQHIISGDDDEFESFDIMILGSMTIHLDKGDFQELYNAMVIAKQKMKEIEDNK